MDPKPTDNNKRAPESAPSDSANETPSKKSKVDSRTTGKGGRSSKGDRRAGNRGDTDSRRNWGSNANKTRGGQMKSWGVNADGTSTVPETEEKKDRLPKKKVAVLIGYNGIGYSGSQM